MSEDHAFLPTLFKNVEWVAQLIAPGGSFGHIRKFARNYDIIPYESTIAVVFQPGIYEVKERGGLRRYYFVYNGDREENYLHDDWDEWLTDFYDCLTAEHNVNPAV